MAFTDDDSDALAALTGADDLPTDPTTVTSDPSAAAAPQIAPPAADASAPPAPAAGTATPPTGVATNPYGIPMPQSGREIFGPLQARLAALEKNQGTTFAQMMQNLLTAQQAQRPTTFDSLDDAWYKIASAKAAANAGAHATAGNVLLHELPTAEPFLKALSAGHQADLEERQQRYQSIRDLINGQQALGLAQMSAQGQNLGTAASIAGNQASYGATTAQFGLKLAQLGQEAYKVGLDTVNQIKNPDAAGKFVTAFTDAASKSGPMSVQGYTALAGKVISGLQASGVNLNAPSTDMIEAAHVNQDRTVSREMIDPGTPQGQGRLKQLAAGGYTFTKVGAPTTNISVNNAPGGEGGGGKAPDYVGEITGGQRLAGVASDALTLLPVIKQNGGSGVLSDSGLAKDIQTELSRKLGIDPGKISVRATYDKLVNQAAADQIISQFKGNGQLRGVQEFKFIGNGAVDPTMPIETQEALLKHYQHIGQWSAQHGTEMIGQANAPEVLNHQRQYNEQQANADWYNRHPFPSTPTEALIKGAQGSPPPPGGSGPQTRAPGGSPRVVQRKVIGGQSFYQASDGKWYPDTQ